MVCKCHLTYPENGGVVCLGIPVVLRNRCRRLNNACSIKSTIFPALYLKLMPELDHLKSIYDISSLFACYHENMTSADPETVDHIGETGFRYEITALSQSGPQTAEKEPHGCTLYGYSKNMIG